MNEIAQLNRQIEVLKAALRAIADAKPEFQAHHLQGIARHALAPVPPGMHPFTDANGPDE